MLHVISHPQAETYSGMPRLEAYTLRMNHTWKDSLHAIPLCANTMCYTIDPATEHAVGVVSEGTMASLPRDVIHGKSQSRQGWPPQLLR